MRLLPNSPPASLPSLLGHATRASPACTAAPYVSRPVSAAVTESLQQLGITAMSSASNGGAAFWQLAIAFACGGLFVTATIGFAILAYTMGATNLAKAKTLVTFGVRRTVSLLQMRDPVAKV